MQCSIIICTHNRAHLLNHALHAVLKQAHDQRQVEILVVDNCSVDDTKVVVESIKLESCLTIQYLYEPKLGLSHARNRGIAASAGDILIFLDDDARPQSVRWLGNIVSAFRDSRVAAAGGDICPVWPSGGQRPNWLHDLLLYPLGLTAFKYQDITELHYPLYPWGANIAFRKKAVMELGGFDTRFGRVGHILSSGEESVLCLQLEQRGHKVVYVPNAIVGHMISETRLNDSWFLKRAKYQGIAEALIEKEYFPGWMMMYRLPQRLIMCLLTAAGLLGSRLFQSRKFTLLFHCKLLASWAFCTSILNFNSERMYMSLLMLAVVIPKIMYLLNIDNLIA